jgi:3-oxoacyl-[acyl-carrier protein] reductase
MKLAGKSALVTGGGQGIGKAIGERFAEEGANVAIVDINRESANRVVEAIRRKGVEAISLTADVAIRRQAHAAVKQAISELGQLEIVVNNAGIARNHPLEEMLEEDWDAVMAVNTKGCFHFCQAVLPHMKARSTGNIVNILSRTILGIPGETNYTASKAAVAGFSRSLALEVAPHGIRVNCVSPAMVDTPWTQSYPDEMRQSVIRQIPLGRLAQPLDIANAVLFLASDAADFITGQIINVCGGRSIGVSPW